MNSKRKLLISMLAIVFVLLAVVATVAIAFALTQQTITTTLNIGYVVEDIDGTASATYTIGGVTERLTAMKGDQVIGDTLVFHAGDTEDAGNLMFPEGQIPLSAQNDNIVIQYTYSNTGAKHYIASMSFDAKLEYDNMKVEYSIDGTTYSENRYAVVVPANTSNKSYWIKISIDNKAKSASFVGDFNWLLSGCDEQSEEYLSLTSVEMQSTGTAGSYKVSLADTGSYVGDLVFPSSVNGDVVTTIAQNTTLTQAQKNQVTSVYIPDSVTTIGEKAFYNFQNLQTVAFEQNETGSASVQSGTGLTTISSNAFYNCKSLKAIEIPDTVTTISGAAFYNCSSLVSAVLSNSVTVINSSLFRGCKELTSVSMGSSVTSIGNAAFYECYKLTNLQIPNTVTKIDSYAFYKCSSLTQIDLPNGLQQLFSWAFDYCSSLTSVFIPKTVTSLGGAFGYNPKMESMVVESGNTKYHSVNNCIIETSTKRLLQGCKNSVIPSDGSVTSIWVFAFEGCSGLTNINIPSTLTVIDGGAFENCTGLTSINIPNSVTTLGETAFKGCTSLASVTIGSGITKINSETFSGCKALTSISIPDSVTSIGYRPFIGCDNLTSLTIGAGVTSIEASVFDGCDNLTNIAFSGENSAYHMAGNCIIETASKTLIRGFKNSIIPTDGSVTSIGDLAFNESAISNVVIPDSVTSIGREAFVYCGNLTSVVISENVSEIGQLAFQGCSSLKSVVIPDKVSTIYECAFAGCSSLTNVTIGSGLTRMEWGVFDGCGNLTSVTFKNTTGWTVADEYYIVDGETYSVSSSDLANQETAATYLKSTYGMYFWNRV